jgi:hypothetical protein
MGVDLFTEILPMKFTDEQIWAFDVPEVKPVSDQELVARARELRGRLETPNGFDAKPETAPATSPATLPVSASATTLPAATRPTTQPGKNVR